MVCLGKVVQASKVVDPWVCPSLPLVHEIVATIEFTEVVPWQHGKQAVWHLQGEELQGKLRQAAQSGERRAFESLLPHAEDERRPAAKHRGLTKPWASKKRKRRADAGTSRGPAQPLFTAAKRRRLLLRSPVKSKTIAKAPASEAMQTCADFQRGPERRSLAHRVAAGRTLELLTALMAVHFLKICEARVKQLQPRGGLFAYWDKKPVFILSVWTSRKTVVADVVPLGPAIYQGHAVWKAKFTDTKTCRCSELSDVGLHFRVANCANDRRGASRLAVISHIKRDPFDFFV